MATRALIGVERKDGSIEYRKVYSDGYLSGLGVFILKNLNSKAKACDLNLSAWKGRYSNIVEQALNEEDFIKTWFYVDVHYLFKNNKWYCGNYSYSDGYLHDIYTGDRTKKVGEEHLTRWEEWTPLAQKFRKKRHVTYEFIEIEDREDA